MIKIGKHTYKGSPVVKPALNNGRPTAVASNGWGAVCVQYSPIESDGVTLFHYAPNALGNWANRAEFKRLFARAKKKLQNGQLALKPHAA